MLLREFIVNVVLGSVSGGVTSAAAVWMLFRPYEPRFGLHGAIPKNKARLAKSIGKTVGERLLTPADVIEELDRAGLHAAVQERIAAVIATMLEEERGSLREMLAPALLVEIERTISSLGEGLAEGYVHHVHSEEFEASVKRFVQKAREQVSPIPLADILTPERRVALAQQAAALSTELIEASRQGEGRSARAKLGDFLLKLAGSERTERFVERTVGEALERSEGRTVGDVVGALPDATYVDWILRAARSPRAGELALGIAGATGRGLLDRPIGKASRWLPAETPQRLAGSLAAALWEWSVSQLPSLLDRLDIEGIVERKVIGFSTERIEEIIRGVTQKQLNLIVQLGYVMGAGIGLLTFLIEVAIS